MRCFLVCILFLQTYTLSGIVNCQCKGRSSQPVRCPLPPTSNLAGPPSSCRCQGQGALWLGEWMAEVISGQTPSLLSSSGLSRDVVSSTLQTLSRSSEISANNHQDFGGSNTWAGQSLPPTGFTRGSLGPGHSLEVPAFHTVTVMSKGGNRVGVPSPSLLQGLSPLHQPCLRQEDRQRYCPGFNTFA